MVRQNNRNNTLISIGLHIVIIILLMVFSKPITVLIPSRSDGMEVSLVSIPDQQQVSTYTPKIVAAPEPIKTLDTPADVNLEQKHQPKPMATEVKPEVKPTPKPTPVPTPVSTPVPKQIQKPINKKAQINDLLGDTVSDNHNSIRKGKALGGNPNGTSDSNNLIGNYADQVINAVRPFVIIPENIDPKAKAIVKVELYPNLKVKSVTLIKSSGNSQYDQYVQDAVNRTRIFPPLPDGANFVDYRILKLTFRP